MAKDYEKKPPLNYPAITADLKRNGPDRLYLLWGEEDYLLRDYVGQLRKACLEGGTGDFDAKRLDGPEPAARDVEEALDAMPFFGGRTFLEIRDGDVNKWKDDRLKRALEDIPDWCTVVIVLPAGVSPDGRLGFVKKLKEMGRAIEFTAQEGTQLYRWLQKRFAAHGKTIGQKAMDTLLFLSGDLMSGLIPEIEKICGHAAGDTVTVEDVEAVAHHIPEAKTFEMTDCIAGGDMDGAAEKLGILLNGDSKPVEILGAIGWQMRRLYALRMADLERKSPAILREVSGFQNDYRLRKNLELAKRFSPEALRQSVRLCCECVMWIRGGENLEEGEALKELILRIFMEARHA